MPIQFMNILIEQFLNFLLLAITSQPMNAKAATGSEKKNKLYILASVPAVMHSQTMRRPENFFAFIARIFQTLDVLLSVLFRITDPVGFEVTSGARPLIETFLDHGLNSCHRVRVND